jgi:hypothetical protein
MIIVATHVDAETGKADRYGLPQIACPAHMDDVNPQFACRDCPCSAGLQTHEAVDDRGQPFHIVDVVECEYRGRARLLKSAPVPFPSFLEGITGNAFTIVKPGAPCPLLVAPERFATISTVVEGTRWVPAGNCCSCQFYRGTDVSQQTVSTGIDSGLGIVCSAPAEDGF